MPAPSPVRWPNPYQQVIEFFVNREGCDRTKMDLMLHEKEFTAIDLSDACFFIRSEARRQALNWLLGAEASVGGARAMTVEQMRELYSLCLAGVSLVNPYVIRAERDEFERAFREEVDMRVRQMIAERTGRKP